VTKVGVNKYTEGVDMEVELHDLQRSLGTAADRAPQRVEEDKGRQGRSCFSQSLGGGGQRKEKRHALPRGMLQGIRDGGGDGERVQECFRRTQGTEYFLNKVVAGCRLHVALQCRVTYSNKQRATCHMQMRKGGDGGEGFVGRGNRAFNQ
jgi:hypothetical protein